MRLFVIAGIVVKPHLAIAEGADGLAGFFVDDVGDEHERRVVAPARGGAVWRPLAVAESAKRVGEGHLFVFSNILTAEHHDHMFMKRVLDLLHRRRINRLAEINAGNFRAARGGHWRHSNRHGVNPPERRFFDCRQNIMDFRNIEGGLSRRIWL